MSFYDKGNTNSCPYDVVGNDGELLWSHELEGRVSRPVVGDDGSLYVHTSQSLIALSPDGEELWEHPDDPTGSSSYSEEPLPAAIGNDECIYYSTGSRSAYYQYPNGGIYATWPNGSSRWSVLFSAPVLTAPRIDDLGNILIATSQWKDTLSLGFSALQCYDEGGENEWTFAPPSAIGSGFSEPALAPNGTIYLLTFKEFQDAFLWAIDPDGNELWNRSIPAYDMREQYGASSDLKIAVDLDGSLYLTVGSTLWALDPDGQDRWHYSDIDGYVGMAVGEDHIFVVDGAYMDILRKDGEWKASYFVGNDRYIYYTPTVIEGDNVIIAPWFGGVQIVNSTGVRVWNFSPQEATADSVVVDYQGRIYIVVNNGAWSPSILAVGERDLQSDILAWDLAWILSIVFATGVLLIFILTMKRRANYGGEGLDAGIGPKENMKLGLILRVFGALLMLSAVLIGSWAVYGSNYVNDGLFEVMNSIPLATLLAGCYITLILASAINPIGGIGQYINLMLITAAMLLSDPLQTVQGDPNDGWVPQIGFILAWLGTGLVLLSGRYYAPGPEGEEPTITT